MGCRPSFLLDCQAPECADSPVPDELLGLVEEVGDLEIDLEDALEGFDQLVRERFDVRRSCRLNELSQLYAADKLSLFARGTNNLERELVQDVRDAVAAKKALKAFVSSAGGSRFSKFILHTKRDDPCLIQRKNLNAELERTRAAVKQTEGYLRSVRSQRRKLSEKFTKVVAQGHSLRERVINLETLIEYKASHVAKIESELAKMTSIRDALILGVVLEWDERRRESGPIGSREGKGKKVLAQVSE